MKARKDKRKPVHIRKLNGNPITEIFEKEETRFFGLIQCHRTWFRLKEDWRVEVVYDDGSREVVCVSKGFESNGASVPFAAQCVIPAQRILTAAILHDWTYTAARLPRWLCDAIFYVACLVIAKAHIIRCWLAWAAVRVGGKSNYNWDMWSKRNDC